MLYKCDTCELEKAQIDMGYRTNVALSKASGINRNELGKIKSGKKLPTAKEMYALASTLCLSSEKAGQIFFATNLRKT